MPEIRFDVKWPDGKLERCYSPSLVVRELLPERQAMPVFEFMERVRAALNIGAERVRKKYGFSCSAALDQLSALELRAKSVDPAGCVSVLGYYEGSYLPPLGFEAPVSEEPSEKNS